MFCPSTVYALPPLAHLWYITISLLTVLALRTGKSLHGLCPSSMRNEGHPKAWRMTEDSVLLNDFTCVGLVHDLCY